MSPVRITWARTLGVCRSLYSTAFVVGGFLCATVVTFVFALEKAEGGALPLAAIWAASVAPWLPVLAAFLGMDVWSEERRTGRDTLLLATPVPERDFTLGKFLGVWTALALTTAFCLVVCVVTLGVHAPQTVRDVSWLSFAAALLILFIQGALWSAVSVAMSAVFRHAAAAAAATLALLVALPRIAWTAMMTWSAIGRSAVGVLPFEAHVLDAVSGLVSSATILSYLVVTVLALFIASKVVASYRLVGRGASRARAGAGFSVFLALVLSGLVISLALRLDFSVELPIGAQGIRFSERTRGILADNREEVSVTCFLPRTDARFRPTAHYLRAFARQAKELGGARLTVRFADPNWDFAATERLVRLGARPGTVVFERGRRHVFVDVASAPSERDCATAVLCLVAPPTRRNVYWTRGHGETTFGDYGPRGMSDIARELARDGYTNLNLDMSGSSSIPRDCALVIVAGARDEFARAELDAFESYLRQGGRLLVLLATADGGGLASLLPSWGLRLAGPAPKGLPTMGGTDVIVSDLGAHVVTAPLAGSRLVLETPVVLEPSAAIEGGTGADRLSFTPLASGGSVAFAAAVERGAATGSDLALRPTRVVVVGDASFALNEPLGRRGNANCDFFLNSVAWLSGTDAAVSAGSDVSAFTSGMDRNARVRFGIDAGLASPAAVFVLLLLTTWIGRRRT